MPETKNTRKTSDRVTPAPAHLSHSEHEKNERIPSKTVAERDNLIKLVEQDRAAWLKT